MEKNVIILLSIALGFNVVELMLTLLFDLYVFLELISILYALTTFIEPSSSLNN